MSVWDFIQRSQRSGYLLYHFVKCIVLNRFNDCDTLISSPAILISGKGVTRHCVWWIGRVRNDNCFAFSQKFRLGQSTVSDFGARVWRQSDTCWDFLWNLILGRATCWPINVSVIIININPLKTKRRPLYLKTQSVPRCKHFSTRL